MSTASTPRGNDFTEVLSHELDQIEARRKAVLGEAAAKHPPSAPPDGANATQSSAAAVRDRAKRMDLFGVSFSGGGIRSGTFCLGVLQALGKLKLLRHVDYLSTVSGGGYIGGWLAAWIRREADGLATPPFTDPTAVPPRTTIRCENRDVSPSAAAVINVERQLDPDRGVQARAFRRDIGQTDDSAPPFAEDREPSPLHHLRAHSRYLSPRVGLLSLDTWTLFAIYLRNMFVNALIFVPLLAFVVLAVRVAVRAVAEPSSPNQTLRWSLFGGFLALVLCAQVVMRIGLNHVREKTNPRGWWRNAALIGYCLLAASLLAVWLTAPDVHDWRPQSGLPAPNRMPNELRRSHDTAGGVTLYAVVADVFRRDYVGGASFFGGLGLCVGFLVWVLPSVAGGYGRWYLGGLHMLFLAWFGAVFGALFEVVVNNFLFLDGGNHPALFATFGPPLFLASLVIAAYAEVALAGGWYSDHEREWRSRLAAWMFLLAVGWLAVFATVVYVPHLLDNRGGTATTGAVVLLSAALRFLVPHLSKSPGLMTWAAVKVVPALFLVALLALVASGVDRIVAQFGPPDELLAATGGVAEPAVTSSYGGRLGWSDWLPIWTALGLALALFLLFFFIVPVNRFSLHALYGNRLIRAYLGASRRPPSEHLAQRTCVPTAARDARAANTFSGFDPHDDLPLVALSADHRVGGTANPYPGPLPLFNTALNLVAGSELAYQDRRSDSFVLTPDYCGSFATGYARLNGGAHPTDAELADTLGRYWNLTVGRAVTISGAAVDPNMANYYSEQFTAFLTIMNARLGWWMANPNPDPPAPGCLRRLWRAVKPTLKWCVRFREEAHAGTIQRAWWRFKGWLKIQLGYQRRTPWNATPPAGSKHYLKELLGYTDAAQANVHLSDGGHFENTGAYELIRRRCRFVLLVDAAENTDTTSENLANLVRLVHADFGIRIQIDTAPLRRGGADGRTSDWHCAVGAIRYDDVDAGGVIGTLLFLRSSLTGDEPPDIRNYAATNPAFPHHPTAHQFFDAAQFESYRGLGYHIGMTVLQEAAEAETEAAVADATRHAATLRAVGALFVNSPGAAVWAAVANAADAVTARNAAEHQPDRPATEQDGENVKATARLPAAAGPATTAPIAPVAETLLGAGDQTVAQVALVTLVALVETTSPVVTPAHPPDRNGVAPRATGETPLPDLATPRHHSRFKRRLFGKLRRQWTPCSTALREQYIQSCVESLREGERPQADGDERTIIRRIQLMELEWLRNDLTHNYSHPIQRGWVNTFRDWAAGEGFRRLWPRMRCEFSREFVRFCERALGVGRPAVQLVRAEDLPRDLGGWATELTAEFGREFHTYLASARASGLPVYYGQPEAYLHEKMTTNRGSCWLIGYGAPNARDAIVAPEALPSVTHIVGVAAAFPLRRNKTDQLDRDEFLLWIRGPYRMAGVGAAAMRLLFADGAAPLRGKRLLSRFPRSGTGPAEQLQRATWVQFMNDFDFYGVRPSGAAWEQSELRVEYTPQADS